MGGGEQPNTILLSKGLDLFTLFSLQPLQSSRSFFPPSPSPHHTPSLSRITTAVQSIVSSQVSASGHQPSNPHDGTWSNLLHHKSSLAICDQTRGAGRPHPRPQRPQAHVQRKFHRTCPLPVSRSLAITGHSRRLPARSFSHHSMLLLLVHRNRLPRGRSRSF